jgi:antitoxin (DNA-binding transcriptional repressor) of toxin-antitoxin stability system
VKHACSIPELPATQCDARMYHMKTVTVRDLRYDFPKVERILREGKEVQITKRGKVIARLAPQPSAVPPPMPDFMARLRAIYGDRVLPTTGAEIMRRDRDRY